MLEKMITHGPVPLTEGTEEENRLSPPLLVPSMFRAQAIHSQGWLLMPTLLRAQVISLVIAIRGQLLLGTMGGWGMEGPAKSGGEDGSNDTGALSQTFGQDPRIIETYSEDQDFIRPVFRFIYILLDSPSILYKLTFEG